MKTACLLLLTIIDVALVSGGLYAVSANPAQNQASSGNAASTVKLQSNRPTDRPTDHRGSQTEAKESSDEKTPLRSEKNRPRGKAVASKPRRPKPVAAERPLDMAGSPGTIRSLAEVRSAAVVNRGAVQNEALYRAQPVRSGSGLRPAAPSAGNLRHRDPNPAVIGGAASSNSRKTAAIDGMQTNLKSPRN
jgi:hypothetical protein